MEEESESDSEDISSEESMTDEEDAVDECERKSGKANRNQEAEGKGKVPRAVSNSRLSLSAPPLVLHGEWEEESEEEEDGAVTLRENFYISSVVGGEGMTKEGEDLNKEKERIKSLSFSPKGVPVGDISPASAPPPTPPPPTAPSSHLPMISPSQYLLIPLPDSHLVETAPDTPPDTHRSSSSSSHPSPFSPVYSPATPSYSPTDEGTTSSDVHLRSVPTSSSSSSSTSFASARTKSTSSSHPMVLVPFPDVESNETAPDTPPRPTSPPPAPLSFVAPSTFPPRHSSFSLRAASASNPISSSVHSASLPSSLPVDPVPSASSSSSSASSSSSSTSSSVSSSFSFSSSAPKGMVLVPLPSPPTATEDIDSSAPVVLPDPEDPPTPSSLAKKPPFLANHLVDATIGGMRVSRGAWEGGGGVGVNEGGGGGMNEGGGGAHPAPSLAVSQHAPLPGMVIVPLDPPPLPSHPSMMPHSMVSGVRSSHPALPLSNGSFPLRFSLSLPSTSFFSVPSFSVPLLGLSTSRHFECFSPLVTLSSYFQPPLFFLLHPLCLRHPSLP